MDLEQRVAELDSQIAMLIDLMAKLLERIQGLEEANRRRQAIERFRRGVTYDLPSKLRAH